MSKLEVIARPGTWTLLAEGFSLEATGVIRDRGTIRCTLSIMCGPRLVFRDNVNLTGDRSRRRLIQRVREKDPDLVLPEDALLALDQAIRSAPRVERNGHEKKHDAPHDLSGKAVTLADLTATVDRWLLLDDEDVIVVTLGAIVAHRLGGESPWLLLIAPPSGTKTEILRMTWQAPGIYPLSELTARTFASGLDTHGDDPSLLSKLSNDAILCLKDMTSLLQMRQEERQAVLAQLREIYDGRFDKAWGTGKELHWSGRIGFVAGVTPVIDQHHAVMGLLGPRFVQLRLKGSDRQEVAKKAMSNTGHDAEMRGELAVATAAFLSQVPRKPPVVPEEMITWLALVADLVTRGRSPVLRDGWKREFGYAPEPESPARLARQLYALLQGVALVCGRQEAGPEDARRIARVALDCIPAIRRLALETLGKANRPLKTGEIAASAQHATTTVRRALEDLQALGLALCEKGGQGNADSWSLTEGCRQMLPAVETVPEKSEGCHKVIQGDETVEVWNGEVPEWEEVS